MGFSPIVAKIFFKHVALQTSHLPYRFRDITGSHNLWDSKFGAAVAVVIAFSRWNFRN